jgi:hypothetical protein
MRVPPDRTTWEVPAHSGEDVAEEPVACQYAYLIKGSGLLEET